MDPASPNEQRPPTPGGRRRYLCGIWIALCAAGAVLAAGGWVLGFFELAGPRLAAFSLLLSVIVAIAWLPAAVAIAWGTVFAARWRVVLLGTAACWGGAILAGYLVVWEPGRNLWDARFRDNASPAQMRAVCHRSLIWNDDPHDEFIELEVHGDESSIPYILWGLRSMPSDRLLVCTWSHGLEALQSITNNCPGRTREAWAQWYAANKHRTRLEWWADGFSAEGYPVSSAGGERSIRSLLNALGRAPSGQPDQKAWLSMNATRMLALLDRSEVRRVVDEVVSSGSLQERFGAARYAAQTKQETTLSSHPGS